MAFASTLEVLDLVAHGTHFDDVIMDRSWDSQIILLRGDDKGGGCPLEGDR